MTKRREFIKKTALGSAGIAIGGMGFSAKTYASIIGANERINVAVIGIRNQGSSHINSWCDIKDSHNVVIKTLCDVDELLYASRSKIVVDKTGVKPLTEWDMRKVFDDKDITAVSIVTPNHWHALATIWACQAGKHVYVEKPVSYTLFEGRKMVEASAKYKVHVQHGSQPAVGEGMDFLRSGGIGDVFTARAILFKKRDSYGMSGDSEPPATLHYDMWIGPAAMRPYNEKKGHYNWHWYWNTGNGELGNTGPHQLHTAVIGLGKIHEHPVSVFSDGGLYGFRQDDHKTPGVMVYGEVEAYDQDKTSQETPNTQTCIFKYSDGKTLVHDTRGRYTNYEGINNIADGNLFYGTQGYMEYSGSWKAFRKWEKAPFEGAGIGERKVPAGGGSERTNLFTNFIDVIRSGKGEDLINPIIGGHYSNALIHLGNISYRLGRSLKFNGATEKFVNDPEADKMLRRVTYRAPYIVPDEV